MARILKSDKRFFLIQISQVDPESGDTEKCPVL